MGSTPKDGQGSTLKPRKQSVSIQDKIEMIPPPLDDEEEVHKERKTMGRTPDGEVFVVPPTHDMVSTLLHPGEPKNMSDIIVLSIIATHFLFFWYLPSSIRVPTLCAIFLFWRLSYNVGIGYLLDIQSKKKRLVTWAQKSGIFDESKNPLVYNLIKKEITAKVTSEDYDFDKAPIEFNTWLVFRRLVDLILMCDFVSYSLFAFSCYSLPEGENSVLTMARWLGGLILIVFNLWVKLDAHRVVKDYAWYWGDFFFLVDQNLTFDGVFEMAPHPMYSVGYAGYYGLSLIVASYTVLFTSLIAHALQFAFLTVVENPHIDKTYNAPAPRRKSMPPQPEENLSNFDNASVTSSNATHSAVSVTEDLHETHPLLASRDMHYSIHLVTFLLGFYIAALTLLTPTTPFIQGMFVFNALIWRLFFSFGIGAILNAQSKHRYWIRHFLKVGDTREAAWAEWKNLFHISMFMCYGSLMAAGWKMYSLPTNWTQDYTLLKHTVGTLLIALQCWTASSIYESLGEYGWFYGDFFYEKHSKLTYSGIYRYVNNPERLFGVAGVWGIVLITGSTSMLLLAIVSHVTVLLFLHLVEKPHMEKLYGDQVRQEAGIVKNIKRVVPPQVKQFQGSIDKILSETTDFVEEFVEQALPRFSAGVRGVIQDTRFLISQYPAKLTITQLADDLADYDQKMYSLKVVNAKQQVTDDKQSDSHYLSVNFGEPIHVQWTAPANHSKKDWIGLYRVADNRSREVTRVASLGRWAAVSRGIYEEEAEQGIVSSDESFTSKDGPAVKGELVFSADKLFWKAGVYEFRYHHNGKHNVMALSPPFEISFDKWSDHNVASTDEREEEASVAEALLPLVRACFEENPDIAPDTIDEEFGTLSDKKYAQRVVYAVKEIFGVDFAPGVVQADGDVKKLAWRICNAKRVLAPFSLSSPTTGSAPGTPKM